MDAIFGLMLVIGLMAVCIFLLLITLQEADRDKHRLQVESRDLYRKNYRLDWDNTMLLAERKQISAEHNLRLQAWRGSREHTQNHPQVANHG